MKRTMCVASAIVLLAAVAASVRGSETASSFEPSQPIRIVGDDDWATESRVSGGSGTSSDPFVIEGLQIAPPNMVVGIAIQNTRAHFLVRGCCFSNCSSGVALYNVSNARIEDNIFVDNGIGVTVSYSSDCSVVRNNISRSIIGVGIYYSDDISVKSNIFSDNEKNIEKKTTYTPWEVTWLGTVVCIALAIPLVAFVAVLIRFRMLKKRSERPPPGQFGS